MTPGALVGSGLRILLLGDGADDEFGTAALLRSMASSQPDVTCCHTRVDGLEALDAHHFDVVLIDARCGVSRGIDFLRDDRVRRSGAPIILLGEVDGDSDLAAAAVAAADVLPTDEVSAGSLERSIRYALEVHRRSRAERRVHALVEHARELILVLDADGTVRDVVGRAHSILGIRREGVIGLALGELLEDLNDARGLGGVVERAGRRPGATVEGLALAHHQDGDARYVEYTVKNLLDDPVLNGVVVTVRDVTDRMERERRIGFQAELLDRVGQTVFVMDAHQQVTYWNRAAAETLGWSWEDVRGKSFADKIAPDALKEAEEIWNEVGKAKTWEGELDFRRKGGGEVTLLLSVVPTRGLGGSGDGRIAAGVDVTELRRAQRELDEHRELLSTVVANAPIVLFALDGQGRMTLSEGHGLAALGVAPGAQVGRSVFEMYADSPKMLSDVRRALAGESFSSVREVAGRVFETWWSPLTGTVGTLGVSIDVTQQQQAEQDKDRLLTMLDSTPDFVGIATVSGRVLHINPAGRRMGGIGEAERLSGYMVYDLHPPWAQVLLRDEAFPTASREGSWTGDSAIVDRDGTETPVRQMILAHRSDSGDVEFFSTVASDMTERVQAAERIRFQAHLLDTVGQAVIASDPEGSIIYWNRAAEELFGWSADEAVGRSVVELTPQKVQDRAGDILGSLGRGERWTGEFVLRRRDGSEFPALVTNAPIVDENGLTTGIVGVSSDLTKVKDLEAELRQIQKLEAVGRLAGGVAHDFNNLLTAIRGHVELILHDLDQTSELWADLSEVQNAAKRASDLTRQLLAFGRKQVLEDRVLDLRQEVDGMQRMLRRLVPESIAFDIHSAEDPVMVRADPTQVHQVLLNLVVNAADAMPRGGVMTVGIDHTELTSEEVAEIPWTAAAGRFGRLTVRDDGTGMSADVLDRIFEPFYTTKPVGQGTGLGLSTVFGIVKQSRGHIMVESAPGKGSVFRVLLPAAHGEVPGPSEDDTPADLATGSETILIAEDDAVVRRLTTRLLRQAGYNVMAARTGVEALAMFESGEQHVDLVLTDVVMPEMGGPELAARLRERVPGLPVLLMSGYPKDELVESPARLGLGFLGKPFTMEELAQAVREALEG